MSKQSRITKQKILNSLYILEALKTPMRGKMITYISNEQNIPLLVVIGAVGQLEDDGILDVDRDSWRTMENPDAAMVNLTPLGIQHCLDGGEDMKYLKGLGIWISKTTLFVLKYIISPIVVSVILYLLKVNFY